MTCILVPRENYHTGKKSCTFDAVLALVHGLPGNQLAVTHQNQNFPSSCVLVFDSGGGIAFQLNQKYCSVPCLYVATITYVTESVRAVYKNHLAHVRFLSRGIQFS